jgi:hypothetical protein
MRIPKGGKSSYVSLSVAIFIGTASCTGPRLSREVEYYRPAPEWRYSEGWDMIIRIMLAGWGNAYSPDSVELPCGGGWQGGMRLAQDGGSTGDG